MPNPPRIHVPWALLMLAPASAMAQDTGDTGIDWDDPSLEIVVEEAAPEDAARASTEAITVVDLTTARRETADLGEQLARTEGLTVQRTGGLGSTQRLRLDGFGDDQIKVFLDGVPLPSTGLGTTIADVPLDLVERVEVFHGVVPIRFGADALGGAIQLVSPPPRPGVHGRASWQSGSWDTHRGAAGLTWFDPRSGVGVHASGFVDHARNDWRIDVEVADLSGQLSDAQVSRRHATYAAGGGRLGLVVRDRPGADRLDVTLMASTTSKEEPHNQVMTLPYGGVWSGRTSGGATLDWSLLVADAVQLRALLAYGHRRTHLLDQHETVVDWFGRDIATRRTAGELDGRPHDRLTWQHSVYGRVVATWLAHRDHALTLSVTPDLAVRSGDERAQDASDARDPYEADQRQIKLVTGLAWDGAFADDRVKLQAFGKSYVYDAHTEGLSRTYRYEAEDHRDTRFGGGAAASVRLAPSWFLKASYEYATRLPGPDEVFGDGILVQPNVELRPETSHNANLELQLVRRASAAGTFDASARGIARVSDDLIVLLSRDVTLQWQNVYAAHGFGVQGALSWTSPGDWVALSGSATWLDLRNRSEEGGFETFAGDRLPNRPWLNAMGRAVVQARAVGRSDVDLQLGWTTRYVHPFFRTWESVGRADSKQAIPAQITHGLRATVGFDHPAGWGLAATLELLNLTDAKTYDVFGVQRPGRTVAGKLSASW